MLKPYYSVSVQQIHLPFYFSPCKLASVDAAGKGSNSSIRLTWAVFLKYLLATHRDLRHCNVLFLANLNYFFT